LKKGTVIVIDGEEMEVAGIAMAKTGKHGSAKAMLMVRDPKTGKMVDKMVPSTTSFKQPKQKPKEIEEEKKFDMACLDEEVLEEEKSQVSLLYSFDELVMD
jgi:hypothetical protein